MTTPTEKSGPSMSHAETFEDSIQFHGTQASLAVQDMTTWMGEQWDKNRSNLADWAEKLGYSTDAPSGQDAGTVLKYPLDLAEFEGREMMRFNIKSRDNLEENKLTIYLYTPPGIALADSASYTTQEFGILGGIQQELQEIIPKMRAGESPELWGPLGQGAFLAARQKLDSKILDVSLIKQGQAINPATNLQFEGVGMRSFTFSYKLVAEDQTEAMMIRHIENSFRKFLYPSREPSNLLMKYPPYWQIQFYKSTANDLEENRYLPFIDLCYLRNISVVYNASTNAFHPDGGPLEIDMSLSFDEAQQNTREDLYTDSSKGDINYTTANYSYARRGLTEIYSGESDPYGIGEGMKNLKDGNVPPGSPHYGSMDI